MARHENDPTGPLSVRACAKLVPMHHSTLAQHIKNGAVRSHEGGRVVYLHEVVEDLANNIDLTRSHRRGAKGHRGDHAGPSPEKGASLHRVVQRPLPPVSVRFDAEEDLDHWGDLVDIALLRRTDFIAPEGFDRKLSRANAIELRDELRRGPANIDRILECLERLGIKELPVVRVTLSDVAEAAARGFEPSI